MAEAIMHPVPSNTSVSEDLRTLSDDMKSYARRNADSILVIVSATLSLLLTRSMLRRELKRLNFTVDVYPYDDSEDYSNFH